MSSLESYTGSYDVRTQQNYRERELTALKCTFNDFVSCYSAVIEPGKDEEPVSREAVIASLQEPTCTLPYLENEPERVLSPNHALPCCLSINESVSQIER